MEDQYMRAVSNNNPEEKRKRPPREWNQYSDIFWTNVEEIMNMLLSDPVFRRSRIGWGYSEWTLTVPLLAYRSGNSGGGSVLAEFFAGKDIETPLPELKIAERALPLDDTGLELSLAPPIDVKDGGPFSRLTVAIIAIAAIILVSLVVWAVLAHRSRKSAESVQQPWERALEAIRALREQVLGGTTSPEFAIARLTDIVRQYLEVRFHLRAERQTTPEFLADMERNDRLLEDKDRRFLRSFLASADMVKFARVPADPNLFGQASVRAEELVSGTIPYDNGKPTSVPGGNV